MLSCYSFRKVARAKREKITTTSRFLNANPFHPCTSTKVKLTALHYYYHQILLRSSLWTILHRENTLTLPRPPLRGSRTHPLSQLTQTTNFTTTIRSRTLPKSYIGHINTLFPLGFTPPPPPPPPPLFIPRQTAAHLPYPQYSNTSLTLFPNPKPHGSTQTHHVADIPSTNGGPKATSSRLKPYIADAS